MENNMNTTTTIKQKVNNAFRQLRKIGYFARQDFWCCQSCAWNAVPEENKKVVFYHHQDNDAWGKSGSLKDDLYLAWSGDSEEICQILRNNGLQVFHDGSENTRIKILAL
jgi:hypothetical protein